MTVLVFFYKIIKLGKCFRFSSRTRDRRRFMAKIISFDMDGTLIDSVFTDWVWSHGIPTLYSAKTGIFVL